jgi:hypothetical protein
MICKNTMIFFQRGVSLACKKLCFKYHSIFGVFETSLLKVCIEMTMFLYMSTKYHSLKYFVYKHMLVGLM